METTVRFRPSKRARAFNGELEHIRVDITRGAVSVWDAMAGHYTTCHSLSRQDIGRIMAEARRDYGRDHPALVSEDPKA